MSFHQKRLSSCKAASSERGKLLVVSLNRLSRSAAGNEDFDNRVAAETVAAVDAAGAEAREARSRYDAATAKVTDKKAMLEAMDNYRKTYPVIKEYRAIRKEKDKQKFYAAHEADFIINDAAKRQLDKLGAPKQLPKRKEVVAEIQSLISEKNECYNDYREKSDRLHELMTMQRNYQMAMPQPKRGRSHEQER